MAIATLGTQQPGQDYTYQQFEYTPVAPPDPMEELYKQAFQQLNPPPQQPRGPTPYWENPATYYPQQQQVNPRQIQQAQEMIAQAMQYQGIRGYQRDLESGKSAAEAMAKWGPMLFAQDNRAFGPAIAALTPEATPRWTPPNPATQQPGYLTGKNTHFAPETSQYRPDVDPSQNLTTIDGKLFYVNRRTGAITPISENKRDELDVVDYREAVQRITDANKVLMDSYLPPNSQARTNALNTIKEAQAILQGVRQKTPSATSPQAPPAPVTAETAGTAPAVTTAKRVRVKSPEGKVGTISSDNLAEALKAGYKEL